MGFLKVLAQKSDPRTRSEDCRAAVAASEWRRGENEESDGGEDVKTAAIRSSSGFEARSRTGVRRRGRDVERATDGRVACAGLTH